MSNNKESTSNEVDKFKELPKYFVIKRDGDNPLWQKYIDWLNKTYKCSFRGADNNAYYGFDGSRGSQADVGQDLDCFSNNPTLLTLEQWDYIVNKKKEFVLPEKWCIKQNLSEEVCDWFNNNGLTRNASINGAYKYLLSKISLPSGHYSDYIPDSYIEITLDQFFKYVLKQDNNMKENQEIIGYELVKPEYKKVVKIITDLNNFQAFERYKTLSHKQNIEVYEQIANKLKEAGVLDLWFSPCYKPKYELPKINGHSGKFENDIVVYCNNCARFDKEVFIELNKISIDCNSDNVRGYSKEHNRKIQSITLDSGVIITIDQIKQIVDYINNNK